MKHPNRGAHWKTKEENRQLKRALREALITIMRLRAEKEFSPQSSRLAEQILSGETPAGSRRPN